MEKIPEQLDTPYENLSREVAGELNVNRLKEFQSDIPMLRIDVDNETKFKQTEKEIGVQLRVDEVEQLSPQGPRVKDPDPHNGLNESRVKFKNLGGFIPTVTTYPDWTPKRLGEQVVMWYEPPNIPKLVIYDFLFKVWRQF